MSTPAFSTRAFCASLKPRFSAWRSTKPRMRPPTKIAKVVSSGRYMPTENSIGLFTWTRIRAMPITMPTTTSGHAISPPTMPCEIAAIRPACGAEQARAAEAAGAGFAARSEVWSR